jgi:hypothetical protein
MMAVYSSVKMVSYLLLTHFLVAVAFGSDKIEHPSGTEERNIEETDFNRMKREILETLRTEMSTKETNSGAIYTRWGRTVCNNGSDVVYDGVAGGSWYDQYGGASNYICLPKDPIWEVYDESVEKSSKLYGSEYQTTTAFDLGNNNGQSLYDHDVPCVVCQSQTKTAVVMIPARNQCYSGWHAEYAGYLMASRSDVPGRMEFVCVDGSPEAVPGGEANQNGALFYLVEGVCGSLPCPPYVPSREITCVVCTK